MSNQDAKQVARQVVRDLLSKYPPGFVVMVLRQLKVILRSTKDLTQLSEENVQLIPSNEQPGVAENEPRVEPKPIDALTPEQESDIVEEIKDRFLWMHPYPYDSSPLILGVLQNGTPLTEALASIFPNLTHSRIKELIEHAVSDVRG